MNKTNSHFLPMEKVFLLFTFSTPLPYPLQCCQDGIAGGEGTAAASPILVPGRAGEAGGPCMVPGLAEGTGSWGCPCPSPHQPEQSSAALHHDSTIQLHTPLLPTAVIQLPPPKTLLPERRGAGWGHKQGLTPLMLPQHPAAAQAGGLVEGWQGAARAQYPGWAGG